MNQIVSNSAPKFYISITPTPRNFPKLPVKVHPFEMKSILYFFFASTLTAVAQQIPQKKLTKIAFGSCGHQDNPLIIFDQVVKHNPDLFIFLGDNIYGDTDDMEVLKAKYQKLGSKPTFQKLKSAMPILATWDDHDFGRNDAGRHYPHKAESK